jgi:hypothetical protein
MRNWELSIGLYPGVLFGIRSYPEQDYVQHVLYLPFVDICLEIDRQ